MLTSGLDRIFLAELLEVWLLADVGDGHVDAGTERGAQVRRTERQVAVALTFGERQLLLKLVDRLQQLRRRCKNSTRFASVVQSWINCMSFKDTD